MQQAIRLKSLALKEGMAMPELMSEVEETREEAERARAEQVRHPELTDDNR